MELNDNLAGSAHSHHEHTSEMLNHVVESGTEDTLSVGEIKDALHHRGFGVLLAICAIPLCFPIPAPPGYTTLFSLPHFILSFQILFGMDSPWIPQWLARKRIKRKTLAKLVVKATPYLQRIERQLKARMPYMSSRAGEKLIGVFVLLFAISIAIPLPMTNVPPAFGILFMALGLLARDGLVILIGITIGNIGLLITTGVILLGAKAVSALLGMG